MIAIEYTPAQETNADGKDRTIQRLLYNRDVLSKLTNYNLNDPHWQGPDFLVVFSPA